MDHAYLTAYFCLAIVAAIGMIYGLLRGKRSPKNGHGGWIGLGTLAALFLGLVIAGKMGDQSLAWFFGLALMAALPIMLLLAIGSAIGSAISNAQSQDDKRDNA